ncbi:uncharacterized protein TrAFT101_010134 [Trichoderma asperellum]|uniref:uncharacterized protein n=1 Tax=Trichoderma asperellum TaxID=101201 RepID=UPI00332A3A18|nr:hypothetical protein TrAFT101_010134 [Trichoderma asperellum]
MCIEQMCAKVRQLYWQVTDPEDPSSQKLLHGRFGWEKKTFIKCHHKKREKELHIPVKGRKKKKHGNSYLLTSHVKHAFAQHASRNSIRTDPSSFCSSQEKIEAKIKPLRFVSSAGKDDETASELFALARKKKYVGRKVLLRSSIGERRYSQTVLANFSH